MPIQVNIGGVWKNVSGVQVNVAGVWKTVTDVPINVAGAWKTGLLQVDPTVSIRSDGRYNSRLDATCYSGVRFDTSGLEYEYGSTGSPTNSSTWLTAGNASDVWIMWTRTGGISDWNSLGAGFNNVRRNVTANLAYRLLRNTVGSNAITGYFRAYDAATGGNLLDTSPTSTYTAEYDHDVCPLCCFTPDTPITMASGILMGICKVRKGDMIATANGPEEVTEIITRTNRPMYRLFFKDGRHLDASDDHPFDVKGKPKSLDHHDTEYKDLGLPEQLSVGDMVTTVDGTSREIVGIKRIDYPGTVYTLGNSLFYANGLLVY